MKITIESTSTVVTLATPDGSVPARVWEGMTESRIPVHVHVVGVHPVNPEDAQRIDAELPTESA